jgi:hypothetical protein
VPLATVAPAGATGGPQISLVTGFSGSQVVSPGNPQPASTAKLSASYVASFSPNGDEVVASAANGYVYVIPGNSVEPSGDYGLGSSGTLVQGDAYAVAGNGTEFAYNSGNGYNDGIIVGHPGATSGEGGSASPVGTSNSVIANSVAFDPNGNILIAGSGLQKNNTEASVVQVVARSTGTFYGVSMTAGNLYTIADVAAGGAPSTAISMGAVIVGGYGVSTDAAGDVFVGADYGVDMLNFGSTVTAYGKTEGAHSSTTIAGNVGGFGACTSGANSVGATSSSGIYYNNTSPTVDASGNVFLTDNEGGPTYGCVWAVPAQSGSLLGQVVVAGNAYKIAGNGGNSATADGIPANTANVGTSSAVAIDQVGNVVLAEEGGAGTGVSPAVQVVAGSSGTYYGVPMSVGDIYTISGGASAASNTIPGNAAGFVLHGVSSLAYDGHGSLLLTDQGSNGTDAGSGNVYEITGGPATAPVITSGPASVAAFIGQTATFVAPATGGPGQTAQWLMKPTGTSSFVPVGSPLTTDASGSTYYTLTLPSLTEAESGQIEVQYTNSLGTTTSSPANLTVDTVTWVPAATIYGTALSSKQLDAKVTSGGHAVTGTFTYSPAAGAVLNAGPNTLSLHFTPAGGGTATTTTTLTLAQQKPVLAWTQPAAIPFGTALSGTQLDATASGVVNGVTVSVPGTFAYVPAAGTIPKVGTAALKGQFTPSSSNWLSGGVIASKVVVTALPATTSLSISPSTVHSGNEQLSVITVQVTPNAATPYPAVGKVTVSTGTTALCTITMAGIGSCVVTSASLLSAGTYPVTATFASSNKEFTSPPSSAQTLTVTP